MSPLTFDAFVDSLRRLELLPPVQLEQIPRLTRRFPEPPALAGELTRRGWLTAFQADLLLTGRAEELFVGHYQLLDRLGRQTGRVYRALHKRMNRVAALKVMRAERLADPTAVAQFYREVEVVARLTHPHLVHAFDAGPAADTHFFATEYVSGRDLGRVVAEAGRLRPDVARSYIRQAAEGLRHAGRYGLVHLGLKPSKLLLAEDAKKPKATVGLVKVLDVGLTHPTPSSTEFLAPEQRAGEAGDARSDVYSLGGVFYLLLTGRPPYPATYGSTLFPAAEKLTRIPPDLGDVLDRMLHEFPDERYQTPEQVVQALAGTDALDPAGETSSLTLGGVPDSTTPSTMSGSSSANRRRGQRRLVVWGGLTLLVGAMILFGVLVSGSGRPGATEASGGEDVTTPEAELAALAARRDAGESNAKFWQGLLEFRTRHPGTPEALTAAGWLAKFPSPYDRLAEERISQEDRLLFTDAPPRKGLGLVLILGDQRLRSGYPNGTAAALSPSGKSLAIASEGAPTVCIWDTATGKRVARFQPTDGLVWTLAFSSDNKFLASGTNHHDQPAMLWDAVTGQKLADLPQPGPVLGLAFGPRPGLLVTGGQDGVRHWNVAPRPPVVVAHFGAPRDVSAVAVSADGKQAAAADPHGKVHLFDLDAGKPLPQTFEQPKGVQALAFSPDGKTLAAGGAEEFVRLWRLDAPESRQIAVNSGTVRGLRFTPDGKSLLTAAENGRFSVWDLETNQPTDLPPAGTVSGLTGLTMDADGRLAAACGWGGGVGLWNLTQKTPVLRPTHGHLGEVRAVAFGADAQTLASVGDDRTLRLWDLTTGKERKVLEAAGPLDGVAAAIDGKYLAAAGRHGSLWVWDVEAGFVPRSVPAKHARTSVAFSPAGPILASGLTNGTVELWRADRLDKPLHTLAAHTDKPEGVVEVAFSPNGKWLASASRVDPDAKVWDVETGKRLAVLHHAQPPSSLAFVGDGRSLAVADGDGTVCFWQTASWKPLSQSLASDGQQQLRLNCSPDGRYLAVVSPSRATIRLFDVQTSPVREVRSWTPAGRLTDAAFAPDSRHLALGSPNGSVYVLRARIAGE